MNIHSDWRAVMELAAYAIVILIIPAIIAINWAADFVYRRQRAKQRMKKEQ